MVTCEAGCVLAKASPSHTRALLAYAAALGQAFQIKDDLLDATGDSAALGKDAGRDQVVGKATFVSLLGADGAAARLESLRTGAARQLDGLGRPVEPLSDLFDFVLSRSS